MTLSDLLAYVRDGGVIGVLLLILIGAHRGWWYPKWYVDELRARLARAERLAEGSTSLASRAATLAERSASGSAGGSADG